MTRVTTWVDVVVASLVVASLVGTLAAVTAARLDLASLDRRRAARCARRGHRRPSWDGYRATCGRCGAEVDT